MRDEETEHDFKEGASFDDVIARYDFDRNLRLILFDAIEIIEVALRAKIINHLSQAKNSGLWYLDESLFERSDYYEDFVFDLKYEFDAVRSRLPRSILLSIPTGIGSRWLVITLMHG
jgi:abortive infection bacteriophage resistance protein